MQVTKYNLICRAKRAAARAFIVFKFKKRKASFSFSRRETSTSKPELTTELPLNIKGIIYDLDLQIKELSSQINYLIYEFASKFPEPKAASTTSFEEVELVADDDFEISYK
ncbi:hypothetical protein DL95DRAFT_418790 [Leptodontidium sp. 2 PMI_412]|nr:hypothetical protein DL95DRAFT_418790 [Leptodontidium sp. 2 PMI_412]